MILQSIFWSKKHFIEETCQETLGEVLRCPIYKVSLLVFWLNQGGD